MKKRQSSNPAPTSGSKRSRAARIVIPDDEEDSADVPTLLDDHPIGHNGSTKSTTDNAHKSGTSSTVPTSEDIDALIVAAESAAVAAANAVTAAESAASVAAKAATASANAVTLTSAAIKRIPESRIPTNTKTAAVTQSVDLTALPPWPRTWPPGHPWHEPPPLIRVRSFLYPPSGQISCPVTITYFDSDGRLGIANSPFTLDVAANICKASRPSSHTLDGRLVYDTVHRNSQELAPPTVMFNPDPAQDILPELRLELDASLYSSFLKLSVYQPNGHFEWHSDRKRDHHHIGTLVVCLPCQFAGGELVLRPGGDDQEMVHDWSSSGDHPDLKWAYIPIGVEHTVRPVTKGTRFVLQYAIYTADEIIDFDKAVTGLYEARNLLSQGGDLLFPLAHKYTNGEVKGSNPVLRGMDSKLFDAAKSGKFDGWKIKPSWRVWADLRVSNNHVPVVWVTECRGPHRGSTIDNGDAADVSTDPQGQVLCLSIPEWSKRKGQTSKTYGIYARPRGAGPSLRGD